MTARSQPTRPRLTEAQLQRNIIDAAQKLGWHVWHHRFSIGTKKGWPDLFLLKGKRAIAWELKTDRGQVSEEQREALNLLWRAGIEACVIRPEQWHSGYVETRLMAPESDWRDDSAGTEGRDDE